MSLGSVMARRTVWASASRATSRAAALLPLGGFLFFVTFLAPVAGGEVIRLSVPWAPSLGANLSFRLDGLSLLFALLICGIGALVLFYADSYLDGHAQRLRLQGLLTLFMLAMLGMVLADNLLLLFIFWELTSLTSYLLIGFNHADATSRAAALQALLVTGGGGLALLAGFLLLGATGGSLEMTALLGRGEVIQADHLALPILLLILFGAFTKSAQVPFHFWLPNAMAAPTPVSAYLHSATMVKAGIYLLARLSPVLGGLTAWTTIIPAVGAATMVLGALMALGQTDLKRLLAYSTVSALGTLTLLLGLGTPVAIKAAMLFLLAHAFYKGALFLAAGAVDHAVHDRDVTRLRGLGRAMPLTATAAGLAASAWQASPRSAASSPRSTSTRRPWRRVRRSC